MGEALLSNTERVNKILPNLVFQKMEELLYLQLTKASGFWDILLESLEIQNLAFTLLGYLFTLWFLVWGMLTSKQIAV